MIFAIVVKSSFNNGQKIIVKVSNIKIDAKSNFHGLKDHADFVRMNFFETDSLINNLDYIVVLSLIVFAFTKYYGSL